ncbi:hypothetical protein LCGC14_1857540, partial [marine sediment metagenome]
MKIVILKILDNSLEKIIKLIEQLQPYKNSPIIKKKKAPALEIPTNKKKFDLQEFTKTTVKKSKKRIDFTDLPSDFTEYKKFSNHYRNFFKDINYDRYGTTRYLSNNLKPLIKKIVQKESIIHIVELFKRIAFCLDISRLGPRMKQVINYNVNQVNNVVRRDDSIINSRISEIPVRYPESNISKRKILNIPLEEIAQAICILLRDAISLSVDETILYAGKIFGFSSVSGKS